MNKANASADCRTAIPDYASPTVNPHSGLHPSSFGPNFHFSAAALGASSSIGSSSLGMSMSPPHWGGHGHGWGGSGSFVGSLGAMGTSFGRDRDREMEARYVRDFSCCGKQLGGLHELLEQFVDTCACASKLNCYSYEEDHANLAPEIRQAAINAAHTAAGRPMQNDRGGMPGARPTGQAQALNTSDVPTPPGMMDIEMDEPAPIASPAALLGVQTQFGSRLPPSAGISQPTSPWMSAFRTSNGSSSAQGVPPSLLSFTPPPRQESPRPAMGLTAEQQAAKAMRKAQRKAEKAAAREEATGSDTEGDKRFPCPVEGCGKVYKQANGLKYHLTRSINSGHGNIGNLGPNGVGSDG